MAALKKISRKNVWALARLRGREDQEDFVASNAESILEAFATREDGCTALPFGIFDGDTTVGFLMIGFGGLPGGRTPSSPRAAAASGV